MPPLDHPSATPFPSRHWDVDALRGLALGGILLVNIQWFGSVYAAQALPDPAHVGPWDDTLRWVVMALFTGKFYGVFSFLFGYSLMLQWQRSGAQDALYRSRQRLIGLMGLGLLHGLLLFPGDILLTYGVVGWLLLNWRDWQPEKRLKVAVTTWLLMCLCWAIFALLAGWSSEAPQASQEDIELAGQMQAAQRALAEGGWPMHQQRVEDWLYATLTSAVFGVPSVLPWMLLGSAVAQAPTRWQAWTTWRHFAAVTVLGLVGASLYATTNQQPGLSSALQTVALALFFGPPLTLSYMWLFMRLTRRAQPSRLWAYLAQAGRMSLTLYLSQSLVCALLFTGYGLGWVGQLTLAQTLGVAAVLYPVQVLLAAWWLKHRATGPMEALMQRWLSRPQPPSP